MAALGQLRAVYEEVRSDRGFWAELDALFKTFVGRPTPLYRAGRLTDHARSLAARGAGATIWLKREDLAHTGAHKINNTLGPGAAHAADGQEADHRRDRRGPARRGDGDRRGTLRADVRCLHGRRGCAPPAAERVPHAADGGAGDRGRLRARGRSRTRPTRRCATGWAAVEHTHYIIGSVVGPAPVPDDRAGFPVASSGASAAEQCTAAFGRLPDAVVACVGRRVERGGDLLPVRRGCRRGAGRRRGGRAGRNAGRARRIAEHGLAGRAARLAELRAAGQRSGRRRMCTRARRGWTIPASGPEHAYWKDAGRVQYTAGDGCAGAGGVHAAGADRGDHPRAGDRRTRWREAVQHGARGCGRTSTWWSISRAAGDKDVEEASRLLGTASR